MTLVVELIGSGALGGLIGYALREWQSLQDEWRCAFLTKYSFTEGGWARARCSYRHGHLGPHRCRATSKHEWDYFRNAPEIIETGLPDRSHDHGDGRDASAAE